MVPTTEASGAQQTTTGKWGQTGPAKHPMRLGQLPRPGVHRPSRAGSSVTRRAHHGVPVTVEAIGGEPQRPIVTPGRVGHRNRTTPVLGGHAAACNHPRIVDVQQPGGIGRQVGHPQCRSVPWHVWMTPRQPAQHRAVDRHPGVGDEAGPGGQDVYCAVRQPDRHQLLQRLGAGHRPFPNAQKRPAVRGELQVGISDGGV